MGHKQKRREIPSHVLEARRRFRRYGPEEMQQVREALVSEKSPANAMAALLMSTQVDADDLFYDPKDDYEKFLSSDFIKKGEYSAVDVEEFCSMLKTLQRIDDFETKAGLLLSALLNSGQDGSYALNFDDLSVEIDYLCFCNKKNVTIQGNVGNCFAENMESGNVVVKGNAGVVIASNMQGGRLTIHGNVSNLLGDRAQGGAILVTGNAGDKVGNHISDCNIVVAGNAGKGIGNGMSSGSVVIIGDAGPEIGSAMQGGFIHIGGYAKGTIASAMMDGEIHLDGSFETIGRIVSGSIYHTGRLVVSKKFDFNR